MARPTRPTSGPGPEPTTRPIPPTRAGRTARRAEGRPRRSLRRRLLGAVGWAALLVVVLAGAGTAGLLTAPVDFTPPPAQRPALILDRNGKVIGEIASPEQRVDVPASQIPDVFRNAVVAAEDKSFFSNSGIKVSSIVRAALNNAGGDPEQGGSTITQQYVKDVFVGSQRSYVRKLKEAALAVRLDHTLSKTEILTRYLNEVYFGEGTYGVQAASEYYFGIPAAQLDLAQASVLAGLIPAPSAYNPVADLAKAKQRQQYVLQRMADDGYISTSQASTAFGQQLKIVKQVSTAASGSIAPQFVASVRAQVQARYKTSTSDLYSTGMAIHTTLDSQWQQAATAALQDVLPKASDPEAAVVVMDSDTGQILGLADKVDADKSQFDTATLAERTSGSTIKPFTLATALENGYSLTSGEPGPATKTITAGADCVGTKPYVIHNDEGGGGYYSLTSALAKSVNTVYGPLAITVGTSKVAQLATAAGMGRISGGVTDVQCSMGLGVTTTPLHEAVAFSTLADGGVRHDASYLTSISEGTDATGGGGHAVATFAPSATRAMPATVAADVQTAMRAVVRNGTGTEARQPGGLDVYGKTGTTDDFTDAWFTGCVPAYHVCETVWMGYDDSTRSMRDVEGVGEVFGGTLPAQVFAGTMDGYRDRAHPVVSSTQAAPTTAAPTRAFTPSSTVPPSSSAPAVSSTVPSTPATRRSTVAPTTSAPPAVSSPPAVLPSASPSG